MSMHKSAAPPALSNAQLGVAGFAMLGISGVVILVAEGNAALPATHGWLLMCGAAAFGIFGYACLTSAMRMGDVSAVTPFRYTRLVFAMIIGALIFHEHPDLPTLIGSAIIVLCGLFILTTARRRA